MTSNSEAAEQGRQARLDRVLADYLMRLDQGEIVNPDTWLANHPDLADDLRSYLQAVRDVDTLARRAFEPTGMHTLDDTSKQDVIRYLGDYEIIDEIARGGMGVVYRARQVSLDRIVAVKMILAGRLAGRNSIERFITEAKAAAALRHVNIVAIFEIGEHDGQQYYSMEYIEGTSLAELIREAPLPQRDAVQYLRTVAEAIAYSHGQGILHRDLKPSNILIDRDNRPRVTDFGLAKCVEADDSLTATDQILGTPSYMPPEQASRNHGNISKASDVYSLGAILYELLCGRPPFRARRRRWRRCCKFWMPFPYLPGSSIRTSPENWKRSR